ncbi:TetR/AcrR family transcriptional regulator [Amycolatopsis sp. CA-126428]|uniref:TetR/AcrR family transcriptional regulator n=1 Tax=Amycolatopsis sp. CA-126428 TaxID=2073158 RepID=UPI000CD23969|nr:TetR/AcrR family transcriptional regulator [Amycolatopsis sp. CA-126428]
MEEREDKTERGETYAGQSRQERTADRRSRITEAAEELFAARSYDDVTVADVCAAAKVAKRYFYEHFADRADLLITVHRELNDWLLAEISAVVPKRPEDLEQLLRPMMQALVTTLYKHPTRARVIYINAPRMELRRRGLLRKDAEVVGRLVRRVVGRQRDRLRFERILLALVAGVSEVVIDWLHRGMTDSPEVLADHLSELAHSLLTTLM